jgi:hypothetical protein
MSLGNGDSDPRGNELPCSGIKNDLAFHCCIEIDARGMFGLIVRNRKAFSVFELRYVDGKVIEHFSNSSKGIGHGAWILHSALCSLRLSVLYFQHPIRYIGLAQRAKDGE